MAAPENGFATWGSEYIISEIPPGWHSGKHEHGEEAIYIVEGEGFSIVNGVKYEWGKDSCLWMPFGSQHQHFNTGTTPVRYFSAMALHIEHWMGMGKLDQISLKGPTDNYEDAEVSTSGFDALNRRIAFRRNEQEEVTLDELDPNDVEEITGEPMTIDPDGPRPTQMSERGHRDFMRSLMDRPGKNGFQNKEIEISNTMGDQVGHPPRREARPHGGGPLDPGWGRVFRSGRREGPVEEGQPAARPRSPDAPPALQYRHHPVRNAEGSARDALQFLPEHRQRALPLPVVLPPGNQQFISHQPLGLS